MIEDVVFKQEEQAPVFKPIDGAILVSTAFEISMLNAPI